MNIITKIDPVKILRKRGLGSDTRVQQFIASEVGRLSKPYVPLQSGALSGQYVVASDGSTLTYPQPYAHYQYVGMAMGGRAPKHYTGKALTHTDALRGKQWEKRMLADKSKDLARSVKAYIDQLGG